MAMDSTIHGGDIMKFSDEARAAVKVYVEEAGIPKGFNASDESNFKIYLGMLIHMRMERLKEKDLSKKDREIFDKCAIYKDLIKEAVLKKAVNEAYCIKAKELSAMAEETRKKKKKGKKKKKHHDEEAAAPEPTPQVVYQEEGVVARAKNWILGKMLDASIAINDWLIEH